MNTIVVGIDSAPWNYMQPLIDSQELPVIRQLMKKGSWGILKSTTPPLSPIAWSSFLTGMKPEKHGIVDWWHVENQNSSIRVKTCADRKSTDIWKYLNAKGKKVGVINIPMTSPPPKLDGFLISSFDAAGKPRNRCWPPQLAEDIIQRYGEHLLYCPSANVIKNKGQKVYERTYVELEAERTDLALHYCKEYDVDVLMINFSIIDHFNHHVDSMNAIHMAFKTVDDCIGRLLMNYPEANCLVISDHGAQRVEGGFLINNWLCDKGYLTLSSHFQNRTALDTTLGQLIQNRWKVRGFPEKLLRNAFLHMAMLFPQVLQNLLIKRLTSITGPIRYYIEWNSGAVDENESLVQFCSSPLLGIYLNPRVRSDDSIKQNLVLQLSRIKDPFGNGRLFTKIWQGEELYSGCQLPRLPDLVCLFSDSKSCMISFIQLSTADHQHYAIRNKEIPYYGTHTSDGIFILSGPEFKTNAEPGILHIYDMFAYILVANGISLPSSIDGSIDKGHLHNPDKISTDADIEIDKGFQARKAYSKEEERSIKNRLEELGYL